MKVSQLLCLMTLMMTGLVAACGDNTGKQPGDLTMVPPNGAATDPAPASTPDKADQEALVKTLSDIKEAPVPASVAALVTDTDASLKVSKEDFATLTEDYAVLFAQNPLTFYTALSPIADSRLAGAVAYAVNDTLNYHADNLRSNGGSQEREATQYATYFSGVASGKYRGWNVPVGQKAPQPLPTAESVLAKDALERATAVALLTAGNPAHADEPKFARASMAMVQVIQKNPLQYYALLTQVQDPLLKASLNYAVTDSFVKKQADLNKQDIMFEWFKSTFNVHYGHVGLVSTGKGLTTSTTVTLDPAGITGAAPAASAPVPDPVVMGAPAP